MLDNVKKRETLETVYLNMTGMWESPVYYYTVWPYVMMLSHYTVPGHPHVPKL
jgi:hypothetical protein